MVGINYDLLKETAPAVPAKPKEKKPQTLSPKAKPKPKPVPQKLEPLRVFKPEPEEKPKVEEPAKRGEKRGPKKDDARLEMLTVEVRKALKKLESGNAVAAYKILEKSIA